MHTEIIPEAAKGAFSIETRYVLNKIVSISKMYEIKFWQPHKLEKPHIGTKKKFK